MKNPFSTGANTAESKKSSNQQLCDALAKKFADDEQVTDLIERFVELENMQMHPQDYYKRDVEKAKNLK